MMRLLILSDLHLEFDWNPAPLIEPPEADVVVLAGDIAKGTRGVAWAVSRWPETPVLYVPGNHEPYGSSWQGTLGRMREAAAGTSVHVLVERAVTIGGVRFLGTPLWTDFCLHGQGRRTRAKEIAARGMNDYRRIWNRATDQRLTPSDTQAWHGVARRWLAEELGKGPAVVVTHHAPHPASDHYGDDLSPAFCSDCAELMDGARVPLWIHGHTHHGEDYRVNGTRVVANQAGYPHERAPGFDPTRVFELEAG